MKICTFFFDNNPPPKAPRFSWFVLLLRGALKKNLNLNHWCQINALGEHSVTVPLCPAKIPYGKNQA
jgi:hypothetical protein